METSLLSMNLNTNNISSSSSTTSSIIKEKDNINKYIKLTNIRDNDKNDLIEIIQSIRGNKCLVLEPQLGGLLNLVIIEGSKLLKENGVVLFKELKYDLTNEFIIDNVREIPENIIYLTRPNLNMIKMIAKQIKAYNKTGLRCQFHIYFIPHRTVVCEQMLEDEGVLQYIEIGEYHLGLIPFEYDILSLELDYVYKQCYIDGDTSSLNIIARSLVKFQNTFGLIHNIKSKGTNSKKVLQKLFHLRREDEMTNQQLIDKQNANMHSEINSLILIDREVDLVSPLITPLTYEGLIDELLGIENGRIFLESSIAGEEKDDYGHVTTPPTSNIMSPSTTTTTDKVTVLLDSTDAVYNEVRDLSVEKLGYILKEKAIKIKERHINFRENKDASLSEIHDFLKKIPGLFKEYKYLQRHINIAGIIKSTTDSRDFHTMWQNERGILEGEVFIDYIEDMICYDMNHKLYDKILRLLCIQSLTSNGIRTNRYENIKRLIIQNYGYEELFTLTNLEKAGLLKRKDAVLIDGPSIWQGLRKQLKLIDEDNTNKPEDMSYVAAGYAPLLGRLIQALGLNNGWSSILESLRQLPGPLVEVTQISTPEELSDALTRQSNDSQANQLNNDDNNNRVTSKKTIFVFIVGGISYLEIAALRYLSNDPNYPYRIIIGTTKLISGSTFLKSLKYSIK